MTVPRRRRTPDGGSHTRETSAPELCGMAPMDFARWLHGREPTQAEARRVYRIAGGETDPGVQWVAAVLKRLPLSTRARSSPSSPVGWPLEVEAPELYGDKLREREERAAKERQLATRAKPGERADERSAREHVPGRFEERRARAEAGKAAGVSGRALLIEARVSSSASYVVPFRGRFAFGASGCSSLTVRPRVMSWRMASERVRMRLVNIHSSTAATSSAVRSN